MENIKKRYHKENIVLRILNKQQKKEIKENHLTGNVMDLTVAYYYLMHREENGALVVPLTKEVQEETGVANHDLYHVALRNSIALSRFEVSTTGDFYKALYSSINIELPDNLLCMEALIITNDIGMGSVALLHKGVLQKIADILGGNFLIIPSSDQEIIAIKSDNPEVGIWAWSVKNAHEHELEEDVRLSDSIYFYDMDTKNCFYLNIGDFIENYNV